MQEAKRDDLTPEDMQNWLRQEVTDIKRAAKLRAREATSFVKEFGEGKISAEETERRLDLYTNRWGDSPLGGVFSDKSMPDDEVFRRMDEFSGRAQKRISGTVRRRQSHEDGHSR